MLENLKKELLSKKTLTLTIKVHPKSKKQEIAEILENGIIKINLKSAPENNKANEELLQFLSEYFEIPSQAITIIQGHASRLKVVKIKL